MRDHRGGAKQEAGKKKKRIYDYGRYSVRIVVVSDTRHVAYYHRYAAGGPFVDTTLVHGHHSLTTPSSISYTSRRPMATHE